MRMCGLIGAIILACSAQAFADESAVAAYEAAIEEARSAMMGDPGEALDAAERAANALSQSLPEHQDQSLLARAEWLQAEALNRLGRPAEAGPLANRAIARLGATPEPTKLYADLLVTSGRIAMAKADYEQAFTRFSTAYEVYRDLGETRSEAIVLQSIGSIYTSAHQYERALTYFTDAMARYSDPSLDLAALNNRANALRELDRYDESRIAYERALSVAETLDSAMLQARILNNIAALDVNFERYDAAEAAIRDAERRMEGTGAGEWIRFLDGVQAQIAHGRGETERAGEYMDRTFQGVPFDASPQNFAEFHAAAGEIYGALGRWDLAFDHLTAFKRLDDESRNVAASVNSALLGAQFEFAEQDLEIEQLRAERLEQDLALVSERERVNTLALLVLLAFTLALVIAGFLHFRAERARKRALAAALYRDSETGLRSRKALELRLIQGAAKGLEHYVLAFEIDRHDRLRAALGFAAFAELINAAAGRLAKGGSADDVGMIAPGVLGVLVDFDSVDDAGEDALADLAADMRERLMKPVQVGDVAIDVSATSGASLCALTGDELQVEAVIKEALAAIEQARKQSRAFALFDKTLFGDPARNLAIMSRMSAAMSEGEIALHYQPKLNLRTGEFDSAEALMRWTDPERGYIPPDAYIPFAEETGHIRELTEWSLERALIDQVALSKAGRSVAIAVNISSVLLSDSDFASRAAQMASQSRAGLIFEVTETAIMVDVDRATRTLEIWKRAGVKISIDDYGTGQSSLAYLQRLPASELKLDRAFINDVRASQRGRMLVKSTVDLAHNLGLTLTAEGVEDDETLSVLKLMGCDAAQGFGLCKPCSLIDFVGFLQRHREAADEQAASQAQG